MIVSYFWVGSISYNSWMLNKLGCRIMVIGSILQSFWFVVINYHYTGFGEVLPFSYFKSLALQGLRIMKFTHITTKSSFNPISDIELILRFTWAKDISRVTL